MIKIKCDFRKGAASNIGSDQSNKNREKAVVNHLSCSIIITNTSNK